MGKVTIERRVTRKYVGTWKHLDKWEEVGTFDILKTRRVRMKGVNEDDITEPRLVRYYGVMYAPDGVSDDVIKDALQDYFTIAGCDHEYDCCGCRSRIAREPKRVTGDLWCVPVYSYRNY